VGIGPSPIRAETNRKPRRSTPLQRTFHHSFVPASANPVGGTLVSLTVSEIEDAGVREVLQTPGAALASWALFDKLLEPTGAGTPFVFREPLGQAREVKVALSGLFGRFVARAYLERYFGLDIFAHLGQRNILLDGTRDIVVERRLRGDLPDWVACSSSLANVTVAEAKGCHDRPGPAKALARAWAQTGRVRITCRALPVTVKRVAIATRWGSARGGSADPMISVQDPEEPGEAISPEDQRALLVGLLRRHIASLLQSLGHGELSEALVSLVSGRQNVQPLTIAARQALDKAVISDAKVGDPDGSVDELVGGVVSRQGLIANERLSGNDEEVLARLNLRPLFVGIERKLVRAAIDGEAESIRDATNQPRGQREGARYGGAGGWVVHLGGQGRAREG